MNKDLLLGLGFFLLMGLGGAVLVWMNWTKIGRREALEDQKNNVQQAMGKIAWARTRMDLARQEQDQPKREGYLKQAIEGFDAAI